MARVNGVNIPATEATAVIDNVAYQRWSRHRSWILRPIQLFLNWPWLMVVCKRSGAMSHGSRLILTQELHTSLKKHLFPGDGKRLLQSWVCNRYEGVSSEAHGKGANSGSI
ncbi:hypothetical protein QQN94_18980 [Escherichia coli]|nr:hypothetical protein [Escherichia coli]MEA1099714.1 hypothetical protein [Escherichia coli]